MDAATWGFIGTLAGAVIGATASICATLVSSWNASRLQRNADYLERIERARAFQRDNILELQDSLQDAMRLIGCAHLEDVAAANWGKSMLSEEVNQSILLTNRKLSILTERVADDKLRSELKQVREKMTNCLLAKSKAEGEALIMDTSTAFNLLMGYLGEVLRSNY